MATSYADDPEEEVRADVRRHAAWAISAAGPVDVDGLRRMLENGGVFTPLDDHWDADDQRAMVEELVAFDFEEFHGTADGLIAHVPSLIDGITLTHVLTADERRRSMIDLGIDLAVLDRYRFRYILFSGDEVRVVYDHGSPEATEAAKALGLPTDDSADGNGSLLGPDGWLDGFDAGDLLAVRVRGSTLDLAPAGGTPPVPALDAALLTRLEHAARRRIDEPIPGDDGRFLLVGVPAHLVLDALAHEPVLLRVPAPPLSDLFARLDLAWDGERLLWRPATAPA